MEPACLSSSSQQDVLKADVRKGEWLPEEGGERTGVSRLWLNGGKRPAVEEGYPEGPRLQSTDCSRDSLTTERSGSCCESVRACLPDPVLLVPSTPGTTCLHHLCIVGTNLIYKQKATYNTFYSFWTIERVPDRVLHLKTDIHVVIQQYCHEFIKHYLENKTEYIFLFMDTRCNSHNNFFRRLLLLSRGPTVRTHGPGSVPRVPRALLCGDAVSSPSSFTPSPPTWGPWGCWLPARHGDPPAPPMVASETGGWV